MTRRSPSDTPLMKQFLQVKAEHPNGILFFRMGDFYEMFFEDAVLAAKLLDLTLTSRDKGKPDAVPMAGLPHHAARGYIARLTEKGHKVVICEQVEDPKTAKGLVKREVVQIVTPGVVVDDEVLDPKQARYLAGVFCAPKQPSWGLAYLDVSTGEFRACQVSSVADLASELARIGAREILIGEGDEARSPVKKLQERVRDVAYTRVVRREGDQVDALLESALAAGRADLGLAELPLAAQAVADVIQYARETQPTGNLPVQRLQVYECGESVLLDETAVANLELVQTLIGSKKEGSLLDVIDRTASAPGGRLMRRWLLYPLVDVDQIRGRHDAVSYLVQESKLRAEARKLLKETYDLERLAGRVSLGVAHPRDLARLRDSLSLLPRIAKLFSEASPSLLQFDKGHLRRLKEWHKTLSETLVDEAPLGTKDGGLIRTGYCKEVDEYRSLASGGKDAILAIEARERAATGISKLRVKYNRVFGYYIEVSRGAIDKVPDHYVRKQTVATAERYVTPELAELETKILSAQEALVSREQAIFDELCQKLSNAVDDVSQAGSQVAQVDVLSALADAAHELGYTRPEVDDSEAIEIIEGRHPVVEGSVPEGTFVPNSCRVDTSTEQLLLITGPNMAGKSTYMRQVAHIVLLAQMGSFVPATRARIGIVDRIFTRVGAADNLARGESTFMVEMRETSAILSGATRRSLILLDEVGRGTSTFDGVSIAWSVAEYVHDAIGARTLFATHYHELTRLSEMRPRICNLSVAVKEQGGSIVFLRQVVPGAASRSYGIDVARIAGLPRSVISRSRQILAELERGELCGASSQLTLFAAMAPPQNSSDGTPLVERLAEGSERHGEAGVPEEVLGRLGKVDVNRLTPLEALSFVAELQALADPLDESLE